MKKVFIVLIAIPFIFWSLWVAFPASTIESIVEDSLTDYKFRLDVRGLKKGMLYNLSINDLILKNPDEELIILNNVKSRINPLYLLIFQLRCSYDGEIGGGKFSGHMNLAKESTMAEIDFVQANISDIQLFKLFGVDGTGTVSGSISIKDNTGYIEFAAKDAKIEPFSFSGFRVPLNLFQTIMGSIEVKGEIINIISLTLEGRDIYARLKGFIKDAVMDIKMELMPGKSFIENPLFLYEFERYKVSPGYYVISVNRRL
ncbi:MAG: type II secretion system protein GspN [Nitrospirae bacterium]|nr:type II secretion system protein GspN [Nitrospirota bacterium]